jgi:AcrR family transcriptional regulator
LSTKARSRPAAKAGARERLIAGMTQIASRHGYKDASVARVVEAAGVSRATFYEHFADKEACFLAAFERAAHNLAASIPRIEAEYSPALRAAQLTDDALENIARDPASARILLVEALAGGPAVRRAHEEFLQAVEATFERWLNGPGENGYRLDITGRAIMEGIGGVLNMRCHRGDTARIAEIRDDLLAWLYAYSVPEDQPRISPERWRQLGVELGTAPPPPPSPPPSRALPRGRSAAAPKVVAAEHRERILAAVTSLVRTRGYTAMTVADIVKSAAVTRESFYEQFRSKEDAFLVAQTVGLQNSVSLTAASFFAGENWPDRVWCGLEALLRYKAAHPDLVYLDVIESYAVGTGAIRRSFDNRMSYTLFLEDGYRQRPSAERLPRLCSETIGNAVLGMMRWRVSEGRTENLLEVLPECVYLALAPFIGPAAAVALVEAKVAEATGRATA